MKSGVGDSAPSSPGSANPSALAREPRAVDPGGPRRSALPAAAPPGLRAPPGIRAPKEGPLPGATGSWPGEGASPALEPGSSSFDTGPSAELRQGFSESFAEETIPDPPFRGKYRIVRPLRVGGTASIYLAVMRGENAFSREVVIKRPLPHLVSDERARLMFIDEAHIAARLAHPNICQVLDLVARDDELYLVLEYLRGVDLREVIKDCLHRRALLDVDIAVYIGAEVAAALHFSHEATGLDGRPLDLVHRDVSPKNIRLTFEGSVKLIDFGIARASNRATETTAGTIKGTLGYMSPEQILGDRLDRRSDIFAFGICLFQSLTGINPFDGANLTERVRRLTSAPIPKLREVDPRFDEALERIVDRCLQRDVEARYPRMLEVQEDLEGYLALLGVVSPRKRLAAYLAHRFGDSAVDGALALALHEASRTTGPIDLTERLRFPDDPTSTSAGSTRREPPPDRRRTERATGRTFTPPESEQPTEAERAGETRPIEPGSLPAGRSGVPPEGRPSLSFGYLLGAAAVVGAIGFALAWPRDPIRVAAVELSSGAGLESAQSGLPLPPGMATAREPSDGLGGSASARSLPDASAPSSRGTIASDPAARREEPGEGPGGARGTAQEAEASGSRARGADRRSFDPAADRPRRAARRATLGGREGARQFFVAARAREQLGHDDEAEILYTLAYEAAAPRPPPSLFLNLGLLARRAGDTARARACLRGYLSGRPDAPDASQIRTFIAATADAASRRCVSSTDAARARRYYARAGARVDRWVDEAMADRLR